MGVGEKSMEPGRSILENPNQECVQEQRQERLGIMTVWVLRVTNKPGPQQRESGEWFDKYSKLVSTLKLRTEYL